MKDGGPDDLPPLQPHCWPRWVSVGIQTRALVSTQVGPIEYLPDGKIDPRSLATPTLARFGHRLRLCR